MKEDITNLQHVAGMDNPKLIEFYINAKEFVLATEYKNEVEWCRNRPPFEKIDALDFFFEYVYVVLCSGFKEKLARKTFDRFFETLDLNVIGHSGKRKAIETGLKNYITWFGTLKADVTKDKITFLETLPYIGPVTKWHLARNIGFDCVKPDVHLTRIAKLFGFESPLDMCKEIQKFDNEKLGVIDVIIWRYCEINGSRIQLSP